MFALFLSRQQARELKRAKKGRKMKKNLVAQNPSTVSVHEKIKHNQVQNYDGAYVFQVSDEQRLRRFLILGSPNTFYAKSKELTQQNLDNIASMWKSDPKKTAAIVREVSIAGRAPNNDYALAALAVGVSLGDDARSAALGVLNDVARIGTHILHFAHFLKNRTGWGRSVRNAFKKWYLSKKPDSLAYQVLKYGSRDGWSHKDLIWMSHALDNKTRRPHKEILEYVSYSKKTPELLEAVKLIRAFETAKVSTDEDEIARLIRENGLTREMVPTQFLNSRAVWLALLEGMFQNNLLEAMLRNLNKLSAIGLLGSDASSNLRVGAIANAFKNPELLKSARLHPLKILVGKKTYERGCGLKGSLTWTPNKKIVEALEEAFYLAFANVEPTNKRICLAIDVSGSMDAEVDGTTITNREAATCMAMLTARTEPNHTIYAVSDTLTPFPINPRAKMKNVMDLQRNIPFGWTHLALPVKSAIVCDEEYDAFIVITDNDVNHGRHVSQVLKEYRKKSGIQNAQMIVVALSSSGFSVADPSDPNMLDAVGFDAALPEIISSFIKREI
jgi:60 kDa SS-A/Ro ribonucleoprotein